MRGKFAARFFTSEARESSQSLFVFSLHFLSGGSSHDESTVPKADKYFVTYSVCYNGGIGDFGTPYSVALE